MSEDKPHGGEGQREISSRFYEMLRHLFEELDQDAIHQDVLALRQERPESSREQIATFLIQRAARRSATVGAAAGGAGGAVGLIAMAPDIFNLVRQQSRLVLSIAFLYDQQPRLPERFREVLATLAVSTGASAGRQGMRRLVVAGLEHETAQKLARRIAGKYFARHLPNVAPFIGSVLGGTLNYLAVRAVGKAAVDYYSRLMESSGAGEPADVVTAPETTEPKASKPRKASKRAASSAKKPRVSRATADGSGDTTKKPAAKKRRKSPAKKAGATGGRKKAVAKKAVEPEATTDTPEGFPDPQAIPR